MKQLTVEIPTYDVRSFTWLLDDGAAEASTLGLSVMPQRINVRSTRTTVEFNCCDVVRDREREVTHWVYYARFGERNLKINIFND